MACDGGELVSPTLLNSEHLPCEVHTRGAHHRRIVAHRLEVQKTTPAEGSDQLVQVFGVRPPYRNVLISLRAHILGPFDGRRQRVALEHDAQNQQVLHEVERSDLVDVPVEELQNLALQFDKLVFRNIGRSLQLPQRGGPSHLLPKVAEEGNRVIYLVKLGGQEERADRQVGQPVVGDHRRLVFLLEEVGQQPISQV